MAEVLGIPRKLKLWKIKTAHSTRPVSGGTKLAPPQVLAASIFRKKDNARKRFANVLPALQLLSET